MEIRRKRLLEEAIKVLHPECVDSVQRVPQDILERYSALFSTLSDADIASIPIIHKIETWKGEKKPPIRFLARRFGLTRYAVENILAKYRGNLKHSR